MGSDAHVGSEAQLPWGIDLRTGRTRTLPADEILHWVTVGKSRSGKSETEAVRIVASALSGESVVVIDPHRGLIERVLPWLPPPRVVDLSVTQGVEPRTAWNPLALDDPDDLPIRMESLVAGISRAMEAQTASTLGNRAKTFLKGAVGGLLLASHRIRALPPDALGASGLRPVDCTPTLFEVVDFLDPEDAGFREAIRPHMPQRMRRWLRGDFAAAAKTELGPVRRAIRGLDDLGGVSSRLLGQPDATWDTRAAIDDGRIILISLRNMMETDSMLAVLFLHDLLQAVMSRRPHPDEGRPVRAFLDEAQTYEPVLPSLVETAVEQGRKFGLRLTVMLQTPRRLTKSTLRTLLVNRSGSMVGALSLAEAKFLAGELGSVPPEEIQALPLREFITDGTRGGQMVGPVRARGLYLEDVYGPTPFYAGADLARWQAPPLSPAPGDMPQRVLGALRVVEGRRGSRPTPVTEVQRLPS